MKNRADYTYKIDGYSLAIEDLNLGNMSVTNDIENVLATIAKKENLSLSDYQIMYCDSEGIWDGVDYDNGKVSFFPISENEYEKAREKLRIKAVGVDGFIQQE
jgi:hypothetical protein